VRVIANEEKNGVSIARNLGIRQARGEVVAFLDADDLCHPKRLELQSAVLAQHGDAGMVFCDVEYIDAEGKASGSCVTFPEYRRDAFAGQLFERNRIATTSAVMVRREVLLASGGFDEELRYNEEYDLWLRIALSTPVLHIPEPLVLYRLHDSNISRNREGQRINEGLALAKHPLSVIRASLAPLYPQESRRETALSRVLFRMGRMEECRELLDRIVPAEEDLALYHFVLGNTHLVQGNWGTAASHYEISLRAEPSFLPALNNLGIAAARENRSQEAERLFSSAISLHPVYSDPRFNLQLLREEGDKTLLRPTFAPLRAVLKPL
jgi:tetratricopeptide (TPR) repeat protein